MKYRMSRKDWVFGFTLPQLAFVISSLVNLILLMFHWVVHGLLGVISRGRSSIDWIGSWSQMV